LDQRHHTERDQDDGTPNQVGRVRTEVTVTRHTEKMYSISVATNLLMPRSRDFLLSLKKSSIFASDAIRLCTSSEIPWIQGARRLQYALCTVKSTNRR